MDRDISKSCKHETLTIGCKDCYITQLLAEVERLEARVQTLEAEVRGASDEIEYQAKQRKQAEAECDAAESVIAQVMDTVNQELRENGPADVEQVDHQAMVPHAIRTLVDLLNAARDQLREQLSYKQACTVCGQTAANHPSELCPAFITEVVDLEKQNEVLSAASIGYANEVKAMREKLAEVLEALETVAHCNSHDGDGPHCTCSQRERINIATEALAKAKEA